MSEYSAGRISLVLNFLAGSGKTLRYLISTMNVPGYITAGIYIELGRLKIQMGVGEYKGIKTGKKCFFLRLDQDQRRM